MDISKLFEHHILDHIYFYIDLGFAKLPVSKHLVMMWLACGLLIIIFGLSARLKAGARLRALAEMIVLFIRDDIVVPNMGESARKYTGYFCSLFTFILFCNLLGLVPFGATATGNIAVTCALAFSTFLLINFAGIKEQGFAHYIGSIVPAGVPRALYPLLFPIELLGYLTKTFALAVRLFANMIAGHFVLISLIGLIFIFSEMNIWVGTFAAVPAETVMALFINLLEVFVAVLQAYIFTMLTAIFTGAAMSAH